MLKTTGGSDSLHLGELIEVGVSGNDGGDSVGDQSGGMYRAARRKLRD